MIRSDTLIAYFGSMSDRFKTIAKPAEGIFRDRGSKFLAFAYPVRNEEEVKSLIKGLWDSYPGVCHVCYAYRIGIEGETYRANDDGEPSGSAGLPILNQIKSKDVTNTLVAIARYFGGTKLGVSGLINAYKEGAKEALEKAEVIETVLKDEVHLTFPHSSIGDVERVINQSGMKLVSQDFGMDCNWVVELEKSTSEAMVSRLKMIPNIKVELNT
ncbi:MAG: putative YigZ family protein [Granulosicoccus sp.]|jgi:uncharacterized YigZ family protein